MGRKAPRKRLACRVMCRPNGCLARTRTSLGAPLTLDSGWRSKVARPGRRHAPRERDGLFDIVRWDYRERFSAEPQVGTRLSVLILRSARAGAVPQNRTRARASRRMRTATAGPSCFETHRSARRPWKRLRSSCCDAPQHEGDGCAAHFWPNEAKPSVCVFDPREGPTCGCRKRPPAPIPCFRVVIYNV